MASEIFTWNNNIGITGDKMFDEWVLTLKSLGKMDSETLFGNLKGLMEKQYISFFLEEDKNVFENVSKVKLNLSVTDPLHRVYNKLKIIFHKYYYRNIQLAEFLYPLIMVLESDLNKYLTDPENFSNYLPEIKPNNEFQSISNYLYETENCEVSEDENQCVFFNDKLNNCFLSISYKIENDVFLAQIKNCDITISQSMFEYYVVNIYHMFQTDAHYFDEGVSRIELKNTSDEVVFTYDVKNTLPKLKRTWGIS